MSAFTPRLEIAGSVTEADALGNALGYVLSQGATAHFSPDNFKAYAFPLNYALVTFSGTLSGDEAQGFFEHLGTIDEALFSGLFAGFTQTLKNNGAPTTARAGVAFPANDWLAFRDGRQFWRTSAAPLGY